MGERCYINHYATGIRQHHSYVLFRIYYVFDFSRIVVVVAVVDVVVVAVVVVVVVVHTTSLKWKTN
jgi:hypothetical protein